MWSKLQLTTLWFCQVYILTLLWLLNPLAAFTKCGRSQKSQNQEAEISFWSPFCPLGQNLVQLDVCLLKNGVATQEERGNCQGDRAQLHKISHTVSCLLPWWPQANSFRCGLWDTFSDVYMYTNTLTAKKRVRQCTSEYTRLCGNHLVLSSIPSVSLWFISHL